MDFHQLLSLADRNRDKAKLEASVKQYSTELPPAKKNPKSNIQSAAVKQFLAKKHAEEQKKAEEAQRKKEDLLSLRAQSSKNNKKAKIMASRTKDNDFSRIRLTDDEVEAKKKREAELIRLSLNDTVQRMRARINLEEEEKLLPKKRKRKSKSTHPNESGEPDDDHSTEPSKVSLGKHLGSGSQKEPKKIVKRPPPPEQGMSFHDLLKVAQSKQFEPVVLQKKVKPEDRPLTKKEKLQKIEEENRIKRKMGLPVDTPSKQNSKKISDKGKLNGKTETGKAQDTTRTNMKGAMASNVGKQPTVIHVQKDSKSLSSQVNNTQSSAKTSTKKTNTQGKNISVENSKKLTENVSKGKFSTGGTGQTAPPKVVNQNAPNTFDKSKIPGKSKTNNQNNGEKNQTDKSGSNQLEISEELISMIESRLRNKIEQELEEKMKLYNVERLNAPVPKGPPSNFRTSEKMKTSQSVPTKKPMANASTSRPSPHSQSNAPMKKHMPPPRPPVQKKPAFHPNPYLQPPRRLLETSRPIKRSKYRVESDEEDDDMSDFIDDETVPDYEEEVSRHIKEIFGYDRSRFVDDDDLDDIIETSFNEQMREEKNSERLGRFEDMQDIRMEKQEQQRLLMQAKKKKEMLKKKQKQKQKK